MVAASDSQRNDRRALGPTEASRMCPATSNLGRALESAVSYIFQPDAPRSTLSVAVSPSHLVCHLLCGVTGANGSYHSICIFVHLPQHAARFHLSCQGFCPFGLQAPFRFPATAAFRTQGTILPQPCLYHQLTSASRSSSSVSRADRLCSTVSTLSPEPSPLLWVPRVAMS